MKKNVDPRASCKLDASHGTYGCRCRCRHRRRIERVEKRERRRLRRLSVPQAPAGHLRLDNLLRCDIAPSVVDAVAWKRHDIGSVVIHAQQFDRQFIIRKSIDYELREPIVERGQIQGLLFE